MCKYSGMKASLDALYTMNTSGAIAAQYQPGIEPLKFLGRFIERLPSGEIIMHKRCYIEHCLKNNDMFQLKATRGLPCVDEKSPPKDPYDENGYPLPKEQFFCSVSVPYLHGPSLLESQTKGT